MGAGVAVGVTPGALVGAGVTLGVLPPGAAVALGAVVSAGVTLGMLPPGAGAERVVVVGAGVQRGAVVPLPPLGRVPLPPGVSRLPRGGRVAPVEPPAGKAVPMGLPRGGRVVPVAKSTGSRMSAAVGSAPQSCVVVPSDSRQHRHALDMSLAA